MGNMNEDYEELKKELNAKDNVIKDLEERVSKMEEILEHIKKDFYSEDEYDFDIICPYCDHEFVIDMDENEKEVTCPKCNKVIELDWTGDIDEDIQGCSGDCYSCGGCGFYDDDDEEEK